MMSARGCFGNDRRALPATGPRTGAARASRSVCGQWSWTGGFSLIEVIAAVAIFAIGMVAIFGMFAPVTRSIVSSSDADAAARVADAVRARLQAMPYATVLPLIQDPVVVRRNDANGSYNPNSGSNPAVIFAKLNGEIGIYDATEGRRRWYDSSNTALSDGEKFFEVDLIRNVTVSPIESDETSPFVAYTTRVRWPAFLPVAGGGGVQGASQSGSITFDHSRKQILFYAGAAVR